MNDLITAVVSSVKAMLEGLFAALAEQDKKIFSLSERVAAIEDGVPVDPPIEEPPAPDPDPAPIPDPNPDPEPNPLPDLGEVEIVSVGSLIPGQKGKFEAIVSSSLKVATVEFFLNGASVNVEKQFRYESSPTIPKTEFEMSVKVAFVGGSAQIVGSKVFVPIELPSTGGGGGTPDPDPIPSPDTGIEVFDAFIASADGAWYDFSAGTSGFSDGYITEAQIKVPFNASDAFIGLKYNNTRFKFESQVPEMGDIPALLLYTPPGANNSNFQERVSIPKTKDVDYAPGSEIAVAYDFFLLGTAAKTGNVDTDIRTYHVEGHVKRNGLQSFGSRPGPGSNPGSDGEGNEFVLMSQYDADTFSNNFPFGNKGDQTDRPEGFTTFDMVGTYEGPFSTSSDEYTKHRMIMAIGIYGHDVTDYDYQSQAFPCYPGTNIRMTFAPNQLYEMRYLIGMNTVTGGVSNSDGYLRWWIRTPGVNGGDWFLALALDNRDWSGNVPMKMANLGLGCYYGGNGKGYYLNDGATANGLWFTKAAAHYKA
jgi:hypothetical protein